VPEAVYDAQKNSSCMDGTRVRILGEIFEWIKAPNGRKLCWIPGMAGTGKTSIAKTVCEWANEDAEIMLGGSFFCSRSTGVAGQRDISCVVPTLAYLLALNSGEFCRALSKTIHVGVVSKTVQAQVKELLYTPLSALKDLRVPIIFVVDALDECGGETVDGVVDHTDSHIAVRSLLNELVGMTTSVTFPVKFLITSRPEPQIRESLISKDEHSLITRLHSVDAEEVNADIHHYITGTFNTKLSGKPMLREMIEDSDVRDLVRLCDGVFIVAATVLEHIFGAGPNDPTQTFKGLLKDSRHGLHARAAVQLDRMYRSILENTTGDDQPVPTKDLLRVLARLLSARMPLSVTALGEHLVMEWYDVRASLSHLHAVIDVPENDDMAGLRPVHASFGDYLFDRAPSHIRIPRSFVQDTLMYETQTSTAFGDNLVEKQVAEMTQDVKELGVQRQEVEGEKLMKKHEKVITTGQALLSPCLFRRMTYTLQPSKSVPL